MWEKDLVKTFKVKYATKWSSQYGPKMTTVKADIREDDENLTPKRQKELKNKKEEALKIL